MNIPKKIDIANLPTKIIKLEKLSQKYNKNIYIKRDDQTGMEISGNKVRKLEYALKEAMDSGCDYLITCGSVESNHARATSAVATTYGLGSYLVLKGDRNSTFEGNYFFDKLLGSDVKLISSKDYALNRMKIMEDLKIELEGKGHKPYILPEGASNGIGSFGYYNCFLEILKQEKQMEKQFDAIIVTVGSGGTYAGLLYANHITGSNKKIYGINICDDEEYFKNKISDLIQELNQYTNQDISLSENEVKILDGHIGLGYAKSKKEEIDFISSFARETGIILDPVYTGKAMYGFIDELEKDSFDCNNILFIHTGGIFGWTDRARNIFLDSNR